MSKAILIMDMPDICGNCMLCKNRKERYICSYSFMGKGDIFNKWVELEQKRPDWCPLKSMPEYSRTGKSDYYQWGDWEDGWNACIDELLQE